MPLHVGFAGYFRKQICGVPETGRQLASLLLDARWPWALSSFYLNQSQDVLRKTRARKAVGAGGQATLAAALGDPTYYKAVLSNTGAPASHEIGVELLAVCGDHYIKADFLAVQGFHEMQDVPQIFVGRKDRVKKDAD